MSLGDSLPAGHTTDPASTPGGTGPRGIDPRAPRFSASITSLILLAALFLALSGAQLAATIVLAAQAALFAWAAAAGVRRHPFGVLYRRLVRPHLAPPESTEDPAAPRFAQLVGLVVTGAGLILALAGLSPAVAVAAALAFMAAFLNAAFGYCIGCQMYVLLLRARSGLAGTRTAA